MHSGRFSLWSSGRNVCASFCADLCADLSEGHSRRRTGIQVTAGALTRQGTSPTSPLRTLDRETVGARAVAWSLMAYLRNGAPLLAPAWLVPELDVCHT